MNERIDNEKFLRWNELDTLGDKTVNGKTGIW